MTFCLVYELVDLEQLLLQVNLGNGILHKTVNYKNSSEACLNCEKYSSHVLKTAETIPTVTYPLILGKKIRKDKKK